MKAVFLGGSRRVSRLNDSIRGTLDDLLNRSFWFFVGDANGADRAMQQYLAQRQCRQVIVYAVSAHLRNNVGGWEVRSIEVPKSSRGFDMYSRKDSAMASDASCGFMLWDGARRGTLQNVRNLLAHGKPVAVYWSPERRIVSLRSADDLEKIGVVSTSKDFEDRHGAMTVRDKRQHRLPLS